MKIRNGFVSNSSSSSFIVAFDRVPESAEEMMRMLFGPGAESGEIHAMYDYIMTKGQAAEIVFSDFKEHEKSIGAEEIVEEFQQRYGFYIGSERDIFSRLPSSDPSEYYGVDDKSLTELWGLAVKEYKVEKEYRFKMQGLDRDSEEYQKIHKEYIQATCGPERWEQKETLSKKIALADAEKFLEDNRGCFIAKFEYEDHSAHGCILEHGGTFRRLPHVRINKH